MIKTGILCEVINSVDKLAVGAIVEVCSYQGKHSQYGPIWRCRSKTPLVSEYGAVGHFMDFAEDWLKPIPDEPLTNQKEVAI